MIRILGIVLIAVGLIGVVWGGFSYTTREKVVDVGPLHASRDKTHTVPLAPIGGVALLIGGAVLLVLDRK